MKKEDIIICNQIAIMEALRVIMAHGDEPELGRMAKTWQFEHLVKTIKSNQN